MYCFGGTEKHTSDGLMTRWVSEDDRRPLLFFADMRTSDS